MAGEKACVCPFCDGRLFPAVRFADVHRRPGVLRRRWDAALCTLGAGSRVRRRCLCIERRRTHVDEPTRSAERRQTCLSKVIEASLRPSGSRRAVCDIQCPLHATHTRTRTDTHPAPLCPRHWSLCSRRPSAPPCNSGGAGQRHQFRLARSVGLLVKHALALLIGPFESLWPSMCLNLICFVSGGRAWSLFVQYQFHTWRGRRPAKTRVLRTQATAGIQSCSAVTGAGSKGPASLNTAHTPYSFVLGWFAVSRSPPVGTSLRRLFCFFLCVVSASPGTLPAAAIPTAVSPTSGADRRTNSVQVCRVGPG